MPAELGRKIASSTRRLKRSSYASTVSKTSSNAPTTLTPALPKPTYRLPAEKLLLYADRGLVVLNKPNGLISQLSDPQNKQIEPNVDAQVLSSLLEGMYVRTSIDMMTNKDLASSSTIDLRNKLGLKEPLRTLHRLDKPTTGALAFACHRQSARDFSNQMTGRQIEKTYLALVVGDASAFPQKQGVIETKLECGNGLVRIPGVKDVYERDRSLLPTNRRRGENWLRDAVSEYEVLATSPKLPLSLLRLRLHTGLKHQLRVHLAQALRTPILGDALFLNPRSSLLRDVKAAMDIPRSLFLHSSRLSLNRYCPGRVKVAVGAPLPFSFVNVCEQAGIPLERDDLLGGVWVDGEKALGPDVAPNSEAAHVVESLGGNWYPRKR